MEANHSSQLRDLLHPIERPKMLVVDDQPANVQALHAVFAEGFQIFMATSGEQALKVASRERPDIILLDVVMPGMHGHEVCRQLKLQAETADIPVLFVTSHSEPEEEARALQVGGVDFITEPFNEVVVKARVHTHLTLKRHSDLLKRMMLTDGLTGIFNRRFLDERLVEEWGRARRNHERLSVIMIDVDHFKPYNDLHGHQQGDDCLRAVAQAIKGTLWRPGDVATRYGGEEFACVLPDTDLQGALLVAQRVKEAVLALKLLHGCSSAGPWVTVSQGVAVTPNDHGVDMREWLAAADGQLYAAKSGGRNRVCGIELPDTHALARA